MADLNQLKQKYQPVVDTIQSFSAQGAKVDDVSLDIHDHHPLERTKRTPASGISIRVLGTGLVDEILPETLVGCDGQYLAFRIV